MQRDRFFSQARLLAEQAGSNEEMAASA